MQTYQLTTEEQVKYGANFAAVLDFNDIIDTAGLTKTIALLPKTGSIGVGWRIQKVMAKVIVAFTGTTTLTLALGDANSSARYLAAVDIKAAAGTYYATQAAAIPYLFGATDGAVKALFTATVDNLTAATAGKVLILVHAINYNDLPQGR